MNLIEKLTQTDGVSGSEENIRAVITEKIKGCCDELTTDNMGNLIARKKGSGKRIMAAAHMDEIGVMATHIDDKGFIRFGAVGGLYIKDLAGRRVRFGNGTVGIIAKEDEEFAKKASLSHLFIDIGTKNKSEAEKLVSVGDVAAFCGDFHSSGDIVISKALDNRLGCYILIKVMENIKSENDLYFVFTSQEEVGLRGARSSAFGTDPDYAIAVDVTDTGDTPDAPVMDVKLAGGAAIKIMDHSILCDVYMRTKLIETAKVNKIPYQLEIMADGGTDAGAIQTSRSGVKTGGISVPVRYIHSPSELASMSDIENCIKLLGAVLREKFI